MGLASSEKPAEKPAEAAPVTPPAGNFRERNWNGLSKTELEEECVESGLSKKGKKEDLIMRLIDFHNDFKSAAADEADADADEESDDGEDYGSEEEDSSDDESEMEEVDAEEAEKQHKREEAIQKAIQFIL